MNLAPPESLPEWGLSRELQNVRDVRAQADAARLKAIKLDAEADELAAKLLERVRSAWSDAELAAVGFMVPTQITNEEVAEIFA